MARSISFDIEGDVNTQITITELNNGTLKFDIEILGSGKVGDLRALFFDLTGLNVSGLSVIGTDVTDSAIQEGGVDTLGQDANIKGSVSNNLGKFDVGIEFGTSGTSEDDIQSTSFILDHDTVDLSLNMLDLSDFGIRYTSVGDAGGFRKGALKLGDQSNGVADNDILGVPENQSGSINVLANDTNGAANVVSAVVDQYGVAFAETVNGFERTITVDGLVLGTMTVATDGTATFDPNGADAERFTDGEIESFSVSYTTVAPDGSLASAHIIVTGTTNGLLMPILIKGADEWDRSAYSVSSAGDVDGDGLDDVIIGAQEADPDGVQVGGSYLVYGAALDAERTDDGVIDLATLTAAEGVLIKGIYDPNYSGFSVSSAGDVDGDGLDDVILGTGAADPDGVIDAGESYVVYGAALDAEKTDDGVIDLATLSAAEGVRIKGIDNSDLSGYWVSSAGDVDGDGLDDVIIGASAADPDGVTSAGESYLVYGAALDAEKTDDGVIDLATLSAAEGVLIKGIDEFDISGNRVSSAGDVDGDGLDDVIIGARSADPDGVVNAGESYLIFGAALDAEKIDDGVIDLDTLAASEGVLIEGVDEFDFSGTSVSSAGDVDGDGLDDVIIGASDADPDGTRAAGESYLIFGATLDAEKADDGVIDLATLSAPDGVLIKGIGEGDYSGHSVSSAGDVDGDGLDDVIIGVRAADPDGVINAGEIYVIFGATLDAEKADDGMIDLATLAAPEGVRIKGIDNSDHTGYSVSSAGDVDGDGLDDIIVGAPGGDPDGVTWAGETYVISGAQLSLEKLDDGVIDLAEYWLA